MFSSYENVEAIGAGTNKDSENPITGDLIRWADVILVMEKTHRSKISKKYRAQLSGKRLCVLEIPDNFEYMDPRLVQLLKAKVPRYVQF